MKWIAAHIKWGLEAAGPLAELIVRNWGVLIGLIGAMLVYGAFDPPGRPFIITVAGISKLAFITLVLTVGTAYLGQPVRVAVVIDAIWVLVFAAYLVGTRTTDPVPSPTR